MTGDASLRKRPRPHQKTGVNTLKRAVQTLGRCALPSNRTALGRELQAWRASLIDDLGGDGEISTQRFALVDLAVRTRLQLDSVDAYMPVRVWSAEAHSVDPPAPTLRRLPYHASTRFFAIKLLLSACPPGGVLLRPLGPLSRVGGWGRQVGHGARARPPSAAAAPTVA